MKVLVTGSRGQLGSALIDACPSDTLLLAPDRSELDLSRPRDVADYMRAHQPDLVLNAAAYTAVDAAEEAEDLAFSINATSVGELGKASATYGGRLIHISTDFVFDGESGRPYQPTDPTRPLGAYGRTKLAGEIVLKDSPALTVRTSWVYGSTGKNFMLTMLRLMRERDVVRVVSDQIGTPTAVRGLANAVWALAGGDAVGICHYSDSGVASWYDFAVAIGEEAAVIGLLKEVPDVIPIATSDFPTPAIRPPSSVLDKARTWELLGGHAPHWRTALRQTLRELI